MAKALAIVGGALADLLMLFLLVILFSIPAPALDCGTRSKIWLSKIFSATDDVRATIKARIIQRHSLNGAGIALDAEFAQAKKIGLISFGFVTSEGTIVVASDDPRAALILQPIFAGDTVTWRCFGIPVEYQPQHCP